MTADQSRQHSSFDPAALTAASGELASALHALAAHDRAERESRSAARATLREKARTGRLKPLRGLAERPPTVPVAEGTGPLVAPDMLEDLAAAAIASSLPTGDRP